MQRMLAIVSAIAISLMASIASSNAQVNTGGSNFYRAGVPSEGVVLERRGRSGEFGCNNPWVPGSQHACRRGPHGHAVGPHNRIGQRYVIGGRGHVQKYHRRTVVIARPIRPIYPVPMTTTTRALERPTVVVGQQPHPSQITRVRVPCAEGWTLMPNGNCGRWVPN